MLHATPGPNGRTPAISRRLMPAILVAIVAVLAVVVSAPIEPSHATTPQNRTNDATTAATTRWRIAVTRRARAARSSAAEGMRITIAPAAESRPRGA